MEQEVSPAVFKNINSVFPFYIPLSERCDDITSPVSPLGQIIVKRQIYGCTDDDGKGLVTINSGFLVSIKELVYPGHRTDSREVENKWLYAIKDGKVLAEIEAVKKGQWEGFTTIDGHKKKVRASDARTAGQLELDPGPKDGRYKYYFLLSPVKMTKKSLDSLLSDKNHLNYLSALVCNAWDQEVLVPDAFHWAVDAHVQYLAPRIKRRLEFQTDEKRAAELFIASTLKAWMSNGDPAGIENELQKGEPDKSLDKYKNDLDKVCREAEVAAAYLAHCVESREFFAINQACMETGGQDLSTAYQMWAVITEGIAHTKAGQTLLRRLLDNAGSLPSKYLFHPPDQKPGNQLEFSQCRWGYLAAAKTFENLLPEFIDFLADKGKVTPKDVQKYLENISLTSALKGTHKNILNNQRRGRSITAGIKDKAARNRIGRTFEKLMKSEKIRYDVPNAYDKAAKSADAVYKNYEPVFKSIKFSVGTIFEIANFTLAVVEFRREENITSTEEFFRKISVVGAASDLTAHVLECMDDLIKGQACKRIIQGSAAAVSIVASVCDMVDFERSALDAAFGEYDYGKALGHGVQTLGAACAVYSASVVLAVGLGASVPTLGLSVIIGVIGAALIFGGSLLAAWLSKNAHENFARFCFFGDKCNAILDYEQLWSDVIIPTKSIKDEVINLLALLSQFTMERFGGDCLIIKPGYLENGSFFEIKVTEIAGNLNSKPDNYTVKIFMDTDEILVTDGGYSLKEESYVRRNADGMVEKIFLRLEEANPRPLKQYGTIMVWVRLIVNVDSEVKVPKENWIEFFVLPKRNFVSTFKHGKDEISSMSIEHLATK